MNKLLITGASGYVGRKFLDEYGCELEWRNFSLIKDGWQALEFKDVDCVLHLAAIVHKGKLLPEETYQDVNVDYTVRIATEAKKSGVKQFIFMSSVSVYGEGSRVIGADTPCKPDTLYGSTKLSAEQALSALNDDKFAVSIVRAPMVYGSGAPGNFSKLLKLVKMLPVLPFPKIANERHMVSIQNLCHFLRRLVFLNLSGVFLVCDDQPLSTSDLVKAIASSERRRVIFIDVPFLARLLKIFRPSLHKKIYEDLFIDNNLTKQRLSLDFPFTAEEALKTLGKK